MELIDQRFGIRLAPRTARRYLANWGFTPQVPAKRALERDPEAVKEWLEVAYPKIKRKAKRDGG
jgi:transposase